MVEHADGPSADDQHALARLHVRARNAVPADAERLDKRERLRWQPLAVVDALDRHRDVLGEAALALHAHRLVVGAGVDKAAAAGVARAAVEIGIAGYDHSWLESLVVFVDFDNLGRKLVARDARVRDVGVRSAVRAEVAAANAAVEHLKQSLAGFAHRLVDFLDDDLAGLFNANRFHSNSSKIFLLRKPKLNLHTTCILVRLLLQYMLRDARCQSPRALLSISTTSGRTKTGGKSRLRYVQPAKAADLPQPAQKSGPRVSAAARSISLAYFLLRCTAKPAISLSR